MYPDYEKIRKEYDTALCSENAYTTAINRVIDSIRSYEERYAAYPDEVRDAVENGFSEPVIGA